MSLFPAYASQSANNAEETAKTADDESSWLKNSSFVIDVHGLNFAASGGAEASKHIISSEEESSVSHKHSKKRKKHKTHKKTPVVKDIDANHMVDTKRTPEFLTVKTIARPSAPKYRICFYINDTTKRQSKKKFKRYYAVIENIEDAKSGSENEQVITKKDLNNPVKFDATSDAALKQEDDLSQTTAQYNRNLAENPSDVDLWLKYVDFQDSIFKFEKTFRKGSIAKGLRVTAERKLAILDKALTHNPNCERLLRERMNIAFSVYPSDELQLQLKKIVDKEQGNIILWQGYIEATQCSMSHCNAPAVLKLYTQCLSTLHKLRRSATIERALLEENILRMLYQCGLFLKQSGLFEQLWTLLRLYLELNLSPVDKSKFNITNGFDEKQLLELEEVVLGSQLPIHELWLRIEKLREACHWLPVVGEGCEDPQRMVFPEDVNELIHPITMPENIFKLTATILTLLKIPLLPCRHNTMQELGLDYVPWALDSVESLLPVFFSLYPIDLTNKHLLKDNKLAVGPQYLKIIPGQEEYLQFVLATVKNCIDCLSGDDKKAVIVWWFRFQRLLVMLDKQERFKMSASLKKKIKANFKNLLKEPSHRNEIICYVEYALLEYEMSGVDSAVSILITAATLTNNKCVWDVKNDQEKAELCLLHRTIVELHLQNNKQKALKHLVQFVVGSSVTDDLNEAALRFKHTTLQILQTSQQKLEVIQHFLPNFGTDWMICNGWFIYLTKGSIESGTFIEGVLEELEEKGDTTSFHREILFEFYVTILFKHVIENPGSGVFKILDDVLHRAISKFPNNLFFLTVLAKELSLNYCLGQPWWKLKTLLVKTGRAFPILFLVLIADQQVSQIEEAWVDTVTGKTFSVESSFKNRILSLFRAITKADVCTRRCGLVWRLYLQFVYAHFDPKLCRDVYYTAVEECPWLKVKSKVSSLQFYLHDMITGFIYRRSDLYSGRIGSDSGLASREAAEVACYSGRIGYFKELGCDIKTNKKVCTNYIHFYKCRNEL